MINVQRQEVLRALSELSEHMPDLRLGQLICALATSARGPQTEAIYDVEDAELIDAIRNQLSRFQVPETSVA